MKMPKEIYVTIDTNDEATEPGLLAWREMGDGVEDDGPTVIAVYRLVETKRVSKRLEIAP